MSPKSFLLSDELHAYLVGHSSAPGPRMAEVMADLVAETAELGGVARMQIAPEQAAFLTLLTRLVGARTAVEVGTFTGASALAIARGLAPRGRLLCCDVSEEWTAIARRAWARAGVEDRIDLRIAPAAETLAALPREPSVDLAFIDADKAGYHTYYEELVNRLRPGGVVLVDNTLWSGRVVDGSDHDADTEAIRAFNEHVAGDDRVEAVLLPIADGLTLCRRR